MSPASSNSVFNLVTHVTDWTGHDEQVQRSRLPEPDQCALTHNLEQDAERFQPSDELLNAINAALVSQSPLLLTGDPGTGKTQTAWFLKRYYGIELYSYQVRSTSVANDLRYDFDAVAYLRDAYLARHQETLENQTAKYEILSSKRETDPRADKKYLKPGPLWRAYTDPNPCMLLIDEIDKAPRDFPNDLLQELAEHKFAHPFHADDPIRRSGRPPITIITSNGERRLPDAFLRRCIVHNIELTDALLDEILNAWRKRFEGLKDTVEKTALARFKEIRNVRQLSKKPGAAELLVWLSVLVAQGTSEQMLNDSSLIQLPALICLIKDHQDIQYL